MKRMIFTAIAVAFTAFVNAQQVGDKIQIESAGSWYPGKILDYNAESAQYFVTYDGWGDGFNEWVTKERIKGGGVAPAAPKAPLTKFQVGDRVEVEYGMIPEPATVIEVGENKYHIKYDKSVFGDKWVTEKQIKKL